jgi:mRNA-degrading endonuclease RelE of RelBE toxin-antitoxin system
MAFDIQFTQAAVEHVRGYRKFEQQIILDAIEEHLLHQPTTETRNRKPLSPSELANWELRIQRFRAFYDVIDDEHSQIVKVKAIGHKEHDTLFIAGQEVEL